MPRVSEFYGIAIAIFYNDHAPPHFHAAYAGRQALIELDTLELREGGLPPRALRLVREWGQLRRRALRENWDRAREGLPLDLIPDLE